MGVSSGSGFIGSETDVHENKKKKKNLMKW